MDNYTENSQITPESGVVAQSVASPTSADVANTGETILRNEGASPEASGASPMQLTPEALQRLLHEAYMQGRNDNIEARIDTDSHAEVKSRVPELIVKGIAGVARTLLRPGRRSVWPPRRG